MIHDRSRQGPQPSNTGAVPNEITPDSLKTQMGLSASIDWLTFSGPDCDTPQARQIFQQTYHSADLQDRGFKGYRQHLLCPVTGAKFLWDDYQGHGRYTIELPGHACQYLGEAPEILEPWGRLFQTSTNIPRLDLAIDIVGDCRHVIRDLIESHLAGHITPSLDGEHISEYKPTRPDSCGDTYYLGSKTSRKRVCVYDKGVQTGEYPPGHWIRWEARFRDEAASPVLMALLNKPDTDNIRALAAGVIQSSGGSFQQTYEILSTEPIRLPTPRTKSTVPKRMEHLKRQLACIVEAAAITGDDPIELIRHFEILEPDPHRAQNSAQRSLAIDIITQYNLDRD